jgi:hypothetical protein
LTICLNIITTCTCLWSEIHEFSRFSSTHNLPYMENRSIKRRNCQSENRNFQRQTNNNRVGPPVHHRGDRDRHPLHYGEQGICSYDRNCAPLNHLC